MDEIKEILFGKIRKNQKDLDSKSGKLGKLDKSTLERIIAKSNIVSVYEETGKDFDKMKKSCWISNSNVSTENENKKGHQHTSITFNGKSVMVHRLMFQNFIDNVPKYKRESGAKQVNHNCDDEQNGRCINPWHMYLGTPKQNSQDALKAGTLTLCKSGKENHNSKLSDEKIQELLTYKNSILPQHEIADKFGINQSQVSRYFNKVTRVQYIKD